MKNKQPRYLAGAIAAIAAAKGIASPGIMVVNVKHDNWCNMMKGKGPCNCNPDYETQSVHTNRDN